MQDDLDRQTSSAVSASYRGVLATLSPAQRAVMLQVISDRTPGLANFLCRDLRDRALRGMVEHSLQTSISATAKWVAEDLAAYAVSTIGWIRDRELGLPDTAGDLRRLRFEILSTNSGAPLSWRRILDIIET